MRGLGLIVILLGAAIVGYLSLRSAAEHAPAEGGRPASAERIERQVQDTLDQYQQKIDRQLQSQ